MFPRLNVFGRVVSLGAAVLALVASAPAQSLSLEGSETAVTGALNGDQVLPSLTLSSSGGLLVWQDNSLDGSGAGIAGLRLDVAGAPVGERFQINSRVAGQQESPKVVTLANGGFLVVWQERLKGLPSLYARFLTSSGGLLGTDVPVNVTLDRTNSRSSVKVSGWRNNRFLPLRFNLRSTVSRFREGPSDATPAALPDGSAIIVYSARHRLETNGLEVTTEIVTRRGRSYTNDNARLAIHQLDAMQDVFFQKFGTNGAKTGVPILVNQWQQYNQRNPAVAVLNDGRFVVVWASEIEVAKGILSEMRVDIRGRLFSASGDPLSDELTLSSGSGISANPAVTANADGGFTLVWSKLGTLRADSWDIFSRAFAADGTPNADPAGVNTVTYGDQYLPQIATVGGSQLAVWTSLGQDGSWEGVYARELRGGGPVGSEVRVNTTTASRQLHPAIAAGGTRAVVVWSSFSVGSGFDLYSQNYSAAPAAPPAGAAIVAAAEFAAPTPAEGGKTASSTTTAIVSGTGPAKVIVPSLGPSVSSSLRLGARRVVLPDQMQLSWPTESGASYQVQMSVDLQTWSNLGDPRKAGASSDVLAVNRNQPSAFYRVIRLP